MQRANRPRIAVVGGGIAGLAAALRLKRIAPDAAVTLIEREPVLGGKIKTERIDGFVIEGGPDSFLAMKPRGIELCRELGIAERLQGVRQETRRTFVMRNGRLYDLPEGLTGLVPTRLGPMAKTRLISPLGKARMALDYVLPPRRGTGDETLAAFIERRLGREVYERLVEPLMAGIYAGDGRELSLAATFPHLRAGEIKHGGLIKGMLAARRNGPPTSGEQRPSPFLAPAGGMAEMVEAIESRLRNEGVQIVTSSHLSRLSRDHADGPFSLHLDDGTSLPANAVILATPAGPTATLVDELLPDAATLLRSIPHVSSATVALAYPERALSHPLAGHGYVIPRVEGRQALACTWVSSKWAARAPEGHALLRVFVGRTGEDQIVAAADDDLIGIAREELRATLGITADPSFARVTRWPDGMPQYTLGHLDRVAAIERAVATIPGLHLAGHAYRGVGIPDCIASGDAAANNAARSVALTPADAPSHQPPNA
ncbi:MAG: protoporphyrinogen oxidase [Thermomicrobiales bacterium]